MTALEWAHELRAAGDYSGYEFSLGENRAVKFIDRLTHTGDYSGEPFKLERYQEAILRLIFDEDGMPRYRYVFIGLPRKNGKTELVGAILVYLLFCLGVSGQRLYSASGDAIQAALIHEAASSMIAQNEELAEMARIYKGNDKKIVIEPFNAEYKALSSEAYTKFGLRPSVNLYDELHVFPNRELHTALETAFGATKKPVTIYITTAGFDKTSLCYDLWERARKAQQDPQSDPKFLAILYEFRDGDDWTSEEVWHRINPALGKFRQLDSMRDDFISARNNAYEENGFRQYYLNQWTEQAVRWISAEAWQACNKPVDMGAILGRSCYVGLDGAIDGDMFAVARLFPEPDGEITLALSYWAAKDGRWNREFRNSERYALWARQGLLTLTPGDAIDQDRIEKDLIQMNDSTPFTLLFADKARVTLLLNRLLNVYALKVKGISQGAVSMNEPTTRFEAMVLSRKVRHGGNPILSWNVQNAVLERKPTGLVYMNKASARERIDGLAAVLNALAAMCSEPGDDGTSVYDTRGLIFL